MYILESTVQYSMLKRNQRLSRDEFKTLLRSGKRLHTEYFTLVWIKGTQEAEMKCGLSVGKKVTSKATQRNKLRRVLYDTVKKHHTLIQGKHVAILTKRNIVDLSYTQLEQKVTQALQKL